MIGMTDVSNQVAIRGGEMWRRASVTKSIHRDGPNRDISDDRDANWIGCSE